MKLRTIPSWPGGRRGIMLVDCLMYIALLAVILTLTFAAFYRANENSRNLAQNAGGEVRYRLRNGIISRQTSGNTNWIDLLPNVKSSRMEPDPRRHVTAWRWELELQGRQKVARVKPLFTFQAVPTFGTKP